MTCTIACPMLHLARFRLFPLAIQVHSSRTLHTLSSLALSSGTAASFSASASASASTSSSSASSALPISSSVGKFIKCKAAIAWRAGEPLAIEDIEVAPPKENEVRIRMVASGVCHTDAYTLSGKDPEGVFPVILGHEGGAVVECVGKGVTNVSVGDHVIPLYIPECGKCRFCKSGKTNLCVSIRATQGQGLMPDKSSRFTCRGQSIFHYMGTSTFASYSVVSAYSVAKVSKAAPLDKIALLGCGITTGIGAVRNTAKVERGSSVAVFGLGGVGLSVIQGAKLAGASRIIAVDVNDSKWPFAKRLGATDFVNPKSLTRGETVVQKIVELTDGGVDYSFEAIGSVETMRQALECTVRGWGQSCIIGVAGAGQEISTRPFQLVTGRRWLGSAFGGVRGRTELPGMVEDYLAGKIEIDGYVTHTFKLQDINKALHLMHEGKSIRSVILFDEY